MGEANAEMLVQFLHPLLDGQCLGGAFFLALLHQIGQADGDEGAVDGSAAAVLFQQIQETAPSGPVNFLVAVLGGVAAGGVQQHRFVGKPPIAVAGAAHPAHLAGAQRETQPGIDQRRGLAGAGWADDDVPGQLVEVLGATGLATQLGPFEDGERLVQTLLERGDFLGRGGFFFLFF